MRRYKRMALAFLAAMVFYPMTSLAAPLETIDPVPLTSPCVILAEASTGTIVYEKNADEKREVASVTKLMTVLLVLEELEAGNITLNDTLTVSQTAAAMKGSQALLDAGSTYQLKELLKATIVASANDSAVALAEYIGGSEINFVEHMNARANELGMENTHYVNATGYPAQGQYTTARDVLKVSCEVTKHPVYFEYSKLWMDTLTHPSGRVTDLTNTNRLVRFYDVCDGLKTGSTDAAKFCISASAEKNGMRLISIVLGNTRSQTRFDEARNLLEYGFNNYKRVEIASKGGLIGQQVNVTHGSAKTVDVAFGGGLSMLLKNGNEKLLRVEVELPDAVTAPVVKGDTLGTARILLNNQVIAKISCIAATDVPLPGFLEGFYRIFNGWR